nr:MAG TPA: Protein of unknown function (DUF448) [Caudoviricetes sp.]
MTHTSPSFRTLKRPRQSVMPGRGFFICGARLLRLLLRRF